MTSKRYSTISVCAFIITITLFSGCASTTLEKREFKSYSVGKTETATIGEPFLVDQDGSVKKVKKWVGILNSPDGWKVEEHYTEDFVRKELIYSGKSGSTIDISYREYRGGLAAPAFFQNLKYDLSESNTLKFQNFVIEIYKADNQEITYRILSD